MHSIREIGPRDIPPQLLEIPEPPKKLYVRGALPPANALYLAVVGSRNYTRYGKEACETIVGGLRGAPIVIVSGLALGIDAIAHRAALEAGLATIAFPGSGLRDEALYPASNRSLATSILKAGGALISEFEPDFRAMPYAFPMRNRLMAGIARGVLVVEAGEKSGTLITARLATDYNRDVFTIPGSIFSRNSAGSNWLIKSGAAPVTSGTDILEHWGIGEASRGHRAESALAECSDAERMVLDLVREPLGKDELANRSNIGMEQLNVVLSLLEIKGLIREQAGFIHPVEP